MDEPTNPHGLFSSCLILERIYILESCYRLLLRQMKGNNLQLFNMCAQVNIYHLQIICLLWNHSSLEIYKRHWVSITVLNSVTFKGNREQITASSTCTCQEGVGHSSCYQTNEHRSDFLPGRVENEKKILGSEDKFGHTYDQQLSHPKMIKSNYWTYSD